MSNQKQNFNLRVRANVRAGGVTIYGNDDPQYAKDIYQQMQAFKDKNIGFKYVNCDRQICPSIAHQFNQLPVVIGYPEETDLWAGFQPI